MKKAAEKFKKALKKQSKISKQAMQQNVFMNKSNERIVLRGKSKASTNKDEGKNTS